MLSCFAALALPRPCAPKAARGELTRLEAHRSCCSHRKPVAYHFAALSHYCQRQPLKQQACASLAEHGHRQLAERLFTTGSAAAPLLQSGNLLLPPWCSCSAVVTLPLITALKDLQLLAAGPVLGITLMHARFDRSPGLLRSFLIILLGTSIVSASSV